MATTCNIVFTGEALAWYAGVPLKEYFLNAEAAHEVVTRAPGIVRERFGLEVAPSLMGFSYGSLLALGAEVEFLDNGNPMIHPCLERLEDFRQWEERHPFDHPLAQHLIGVWRAVTARGVKVGLPFGNEAPFTAAVLLRGPDFLIDVVEQPELAKAFLDRLTDNWLAVRNACYALAGETPSGESVWLADDFSGFLKPGPFREFVLPTYARIYEETSAIYRALHSELLHPEHLPLLGEVGLNYFDPNVDQYLTVDDMRERLPKGMDWNWRIIASHMNHHTPEELVAEYEEGVRGGAPSIMADVMPEVPDENVLAVKEIGARYSATD
ncbi:MAG: uroporphyrinogen decarboxylase family protein [Armatimonadota bacterium]